MHAAIFGQIKAVDFLLQAGADVTAKDKSGKTAFDLARSDDVKKIIQAQINQNQNVPQEST